MSHNPSSEPNEQVNIYNSVVEGQIGQAGRDLRQLQVIVFGQKAADSDQEIQTRQVLINKVRNYWVRVVLEQLSCNLSLVKLSLEERLDVLEKSGGVVYETPNQLRQTLPSNTKILDYFTQLGEGGTLLILGETGSDQTKTMLELAKDLLSIAESNVMFPLPVVLDLSSYKGMGQTFVNWLVQELHTRYQIPETLGKKWVKDEQLLLLLNGLNKLHVTHRNACVLALNQFVQKHGTTEVIVCSYIEDYDVLSHRLKFQSAIHIKSISG